MPVADKRKHFPPPTDFGPLPFSNGVFAGNTFYTSGHLGMDPATQAIPADIEREIRFLLDGFRETLFRARLVMEDLVCVQVFCPNVSLFDKFNAVYRTYFSGKFPARAFLGSGPLLFGAHFEIQGIAMRASRRNRRGHVGESKNRAKLALDGTSRGSTRRSR